MKKGRRMGAEIYLLAEAEQKLSLYLTLADGEISGFGRARMESTSRRVVVEDVFILEQEAGVAHTELDEDAMQDLLYDLVKRGERVEDICVWWHSHGAGPLFFSSLDEHTIDLFEDLGRPWMISIVGNKSLEYEARVDYYEPLRATLHGVKVRRLAQSEGHMVERISSEIHRKVRRKEKKEKMITKALVPWWGWEKEKEKPSEVKHFAD